MSEIKGYTAEEVAKTLKQKLEKEYDFIKQKEQEVKHKEEEVLRIRGVIRDKKQEYRIASVQRVLEYIRFAKITDEHELDTLLCHCQNKLNGNIDGVEITLKGDKA